MKAAQFYLTLALAAVTLILALTYVVMSESNRKLQQEYAQQTQVISSGRLAEQLTRQMLADLARVSVRNDRFRELLARHGYRVEVQAAAPEAAATPEATPTPTPAPTPTATPAQSRPTRRPR